MLFYLLFIDVLLRKTAIIFLFFIFLWVEEVAAYRYKLHAKSHLFTNKREPELTCKLTLNNFFKCFIFLSLSFCCVHIQYQLLSINKCHLLVPESRDRNYRWIEEDIFFKHTKAKHDIIYKAMHSKEPLTTIINKSIW